MPTMFVEANERVMAARVVAESTRSQKPCGLCEMIHVQQDGGGGLAGDLLVHALVKGKYGNPGYLAHDAHYW